MNMNQPNNQSMYATITHRYRILLDTMVSFRSISTDDAFREENKRTAEWLQEVLATSGFTVRLIHGSNSNPLVYARYYQSPELPTILIYGHYDVQPASLSDGWTSDPFTVDERNGRLYGRGIVDNKGQVLIHLASVITLIEQQKLNANITFMIEGNEESGNEDLPQQIAQENLLADVDLVLVSDGELRLGKPSIEASFRGGANLRVTIQTALSDLHSGIFGGAVPSASMVLTNILSSLKDHTNRVLVPNFYDGVVPPQNRNSQTQDEQDNEQGQNVATCKQLLMPLSNNIYIETGCYPTLEITGIATGYTGVGFQNIVPHIAEARINVRTAPGQITSKVVQQLVQYLQDQTPSYADLCIDDDIHMNEPILLDQNSPYIAVVSSILGKVYESPVIKSYVGGSIPIIGVLSDNGMIPVASIPLANDDCRMHGADENFELALIEKGIAFSYELLSIIEKT